MSKEYLNHAREILTSVYSVFKPGSKESGLISLFGSQNSHDLREGLPLLTTRQMFLKSGIHELIWFLRGDTNIRYLEQNKVPFWRKDAFEHNVEAMVVAGIFSDSVLTKYSSAWDGALEEYSKRIVEDSEFAQRFGDAGPIYGRQWRAWSGKDGKPVDQLKRMIDGLKKNPTGKKHIVSAWNPVDVPDMSLPPCHVMYQATSDGQGNMDLQLYQRSCDEFLGVPFNIVSYAMLTELIAREAGLKPRRFVHTFGDAHFYTGLGARSKWYGDNFKELQQRVVAIPMTDPERHLEVLDWVNREAPNDSNESKYDHVSAILEQLSRKPLSKPRLVVANKPLDELAFEDFRIEGYEYHPRINRSMAV